MISAKAIGVTVSETFLVRANKVIEMNEGHVACGSRVAFAATSCAGESLERAFHPGLDDDGSPLLNLGFYLVAELVRPQKLRLDALHAEH